MIIDHIDNSHLYFALHPGIQCAFDYVQKADLFAMKIGKYEIDGEHMYAMLQQYDTRSKEQGAWEAHRRYIDLQVVIQGTEKVGYANLRRLTQGEYDANRDFLPLFGEGDFLTLPHGNFVLLMPEDAHMPGIACNSPAPVRKIVIKIAVR